MPEKGSGQINLSKGYGGKRDGMGIDTNPRPNAPTKGTGITNKMRTGIDPVTNKTKNTSGKAITQKGCE